MIEPDAVDSAGSDSAAQPRLLPRLGGVDVTDLSAAAGAIVWVGLALASRSGSVGPGTVDLFVALAVLVLVPLGLGLVPPSQPPAWTATGFRIATVAQFPAALAVVGALVLPVETPASIALAVPWLAVTGGVALFGLGRLLERGIRPLPELAVDAALLYLPVGAVALVLHRAGVSFHFDPLIVLLTVVHYHYAGFVLPLVAGLLGRHLTDEEGRFGTDPEGRLGAVLLSLIVVNIGVIAVGITFSPLVEVVAVATFTVAVAAFGALVLARVVPTLPRLPAVLLSVAALALFLTMALALAYGYSAFPATGRLIGIGEMVRWHGTLNAFAFSLPALVAFRLLADSPATR